MNRAAKTKVDKFSAKKMYEFVSLNQSMSCVYSESVYWGCCPWRYYFFYNGFLSLFKYSIGAKWKYEKEWFVLKEILDQGMHCQILHSCLLLNITLYGWIDGWMIDKWIAEKKENCLWLCSDDKNVDQTKENVIWSDSFLRRSVRQGIMWLWPRQFS